MLKFCRDAWNNNKDKLEAAIREDSLMNSCGYDYLVELIVKYILNPFVKDEDREFWIDGITVIDNGGYQGTRLYIIPRKIYQPSASDYLMTYAYYGSCSYCDTLQGIQSWELTTPTEEQVKDFMSLCKDLVCNIIKPYNYGWRKDEEFEEVAVFENPSDNLKFL